MIEVEKDHRAKMEQLRVAMTTKTAMTSVNGRWRGRTSSKSIQIGRLVRRPW
jgi:hypothetical protein